jgi:sulfatase maturation enzyme AslB (radical SAM superfamily)
MISVEEFENSAYLDNTRQKLLRNEIPNDCQLCKNDEDRGIPSLRQQSLKDFGNITSPTLQYLDLRYDNLCNLACRMCHAGYSSTWAKEVDKHPELLTYHKPFNRINAVSKIIDDFDNITKNLKKLSLTGGEPLLIKDHLVILSKLIEQGRTDIELTITTNLTVLNKQWVEVVKKFSTVHWTVSIDGVRAVGEYIRWPYNWNNVDTNLDQLFKLNHSIGINCTLTIYSLLDLSNLVKYFVNKKQQVQSPFELWFAVPEFPKSLTIAALSEEHKDKIINELSISIDLLKNLPDHETSLNILISVQNIVNQTIPNISLINEFWDYTNMLDDQRNQNFNDTFKL